MSKLLKTVPLVEGDDVTVPEWMEIWDDAYVYCCFNGREVLRRLVPQVQIEGGSDG